MKERKKGKKKYQPGVTSPTPWGDRGEPEAPEVPAHSQSAERWALVTAQVPASSSVPSQASVPLGGCQLGKPGLLLDLQPLQAVLCGMSQAISPTYVLSLTSWDPCQTSRSSFRPERVPSPDSTRARGLARGIPASAGPFEPCAPKGWK